jgi:nucleotide-binding universal stress UspA family protein
MPFERILAAIDDSDWSNRALVKALEVAKATGAQLTALAVEGPLPAYAATVGEVDEVKREKDAFFTSLAAEARQQAEAAGVAIDVAVKPGHPAELINRYTADGNYDLIVLGHKGHSVRDRLLGATADRVAENAPCPVMIVP